MAGRGVFFLSSSHDVDVGKAVRCVGEKRGWGTQKKQAA